MKECCVCKCAVGDNPAYILLTNRVAEICNTCRQKMIVIKSSRNQENVQEARNYFSEKIKICTDSDTSYFLQKIRINEQLETKNENDMIIYFIGNYTLQKEDLPTNNNSEKNIDSLNFTIKNMTESSNNSSVENKAVVKNTGKFFSPIEKQIATIGTSYMIEFLSTGSIIKAGATLTNKRLYFSGKTLTTGPSRQFVTSRKIVNVEDITGTGFIINSPIYLMVLSILSILGGIIGFATEITGVGVVGIILFILFLVIYYLRKETILFVEYAGGYIGFSVKWIEYAEQENFIKQIHLAKDNYNKE
jgi:hypothetical protein